MHPPTAQQKQACDLGAESLLKKELERHKVDLKTWYHAVYLESDHWRDLRLRAFFHHGKRCHQCRSPHQLQVHHLRYRSIFDVTVEDLQILCDSCHKLEHLGLSQPRKLRKPRMPGKSAQKSGPQPDWHHATACAGFRKLLSGYIGSVFEARFRECANISPLNRRYEKAAEKTLLVLKVFPDSEQVLAVKAMTEGKRGANARKRLKQLRPK